MGRDEQCTRRARECVAKMTVEEAASQLLHDSPAVERLGIPAYNWWNEALHGVARAGVATVFPQAIALAATFGEELLHKVAEVISEEARAKYNAAKEAGDRDIYKGLTFWAPNINIFRDPLWGRGQETYGEDPFLTSRLAVAFIRGMQGDGEVMKTAACAKHFACYSGPEAGRHAFNAAVREKDLEETYLPAFEAAVKEGKVEAVMGAYNALNGEPCCANDFLLNQKLRGEWGFQGHVVSDCWAVADFHKSHRFTASAPESASLAVRRGCDLNCGCTYENLLEGLRQGLIEESEIRRACIRVLTTRFKLGMFDDFCEYDEIPYERVGCPSHAELALRTAEKSAVLLKNDGILPLRKEKLKNIAVIGPNADSVPVLCGNYNGDSGNFITNLRGIREEVGEKIRVFYSKGAQLYLEADPLCKPYNLLGEALKIAKLSDAVILCVGYDPTIEGEEGDTGNSFASGDRVDLLLPLSQRRLCAAVLALKKPTVLVINSGGGIDVSEYEPAASAILQCWYSGEAGGKALANILFGKANPSGKLPVSVYYNDQPLPPIEDYSMQGRTYRYLQGKPLYPFGYGLSYTTYRYSQLSIEVGEYLSGKVYVKNEGDIDGEEIIEGYVRYEGETLQKPRFSLCFFDRRRIRTGEEILVRFTVARRQMESVSLRGERKLLDGEYTLFVGGSAPDPRSAELCGGEMQTVRFYIQKGIIKI